MKKLILLTALALAQTAFAAPVTSTSLRYSVTAIPMITGASAMIGTSVNSFGDIAGYAYLQDGGSQAFSYVNGRAEFIPTLGGSRNSAAGINDARQVAGWSETSNPGEYRPFLFSNTGTLQDLGTVGGRSSIATAINNNGIISGYSSVRLPYEDPYTAFTASSSVTPSPVNFGPSVVGSSFAYALNDHNDVTGSVYSADNSRVSAFVAYNDKTVLLDTLGGSSGTGMAINNKGQVVGSSSLENGDSRAFFFDGSTVTNLGTISGAGNLGAGLGTPAYSGADGINDSGTIVGTFGFSGYQGRGFVYVDGAMLDLTAYLDALDEGKWEITNAMAINNAGQIVAYGYRYDAPVGTTLLLTPNSVPEPSSLLLFMLAICVLATAMRYRKRLDRNK